MRGSLGRGPDVGLVEGSRAAEAGVVNEDVVLSSWVLWGATDTFESNMRIVVDRGGVEKGRLSGG